MDMPVGAAVDVGTTNIVAQMVSMADGEILETSSIQNPQTRIGPDVITRARYCSHSRSNLESVRRTTVAAIQSVILGMFESLCLDARSLRRIVFVGNTVMHHILLGLPLDSLLMPPYHADHTEEVITTTMAIGMKLLPDTSVYIPPLVESFIGNDAIANLLFVNRTNQKHPVLFLDIGTNTEIAVITDDKILITSAASGPAFEGMSLQCGMSARSGAIDSVIIADAFARPQIHTIGDTAPCGICGTGVVSLLAGLLQSGLMNESGSLNRDSPSPRLHKDDGLLRYMLVTESETTTHQSIFLSQVDIRMVQQSKAAIAAAIMMLLKTAEVLPSEIVHTVIAGVFGSRLDLANATTIGLLPKLTGSSFSLIENGAIEGARILLINDDAQQEVSHLVERIEYIDLMDNPDYESMMAELQFFRPI